MSQPPPPPPPPPVPPQVREISLQLSDGQAIACQQYYCKANPTDDGEGETRETRILCLHGWLDNCRSFYHLAPELAERLCHTQRDGIHVTHTNVNVVAMDFVGHGLSSHKSLDGPSILLTESAFYVAEVIEKLGWWQGSNAGGGGTNGGKSSRRNNQNTNNNGNNHHRHRHHHSASPDDNDSGAAPPNKRQKTTGDNNHNNNNHDNNIPFILVGHSMGASVACVMAASFPERVERLVLLDGAGPLDRPAANIAKHVRNHIERRQAGNKRLLMESRMLYPSLDVAVSLRRKTATNFPGNQYLSVEAAREMVLRGSEIDDDSGGRVKFLHDPRLRWPSAHYFTAEQTEAIYADIRCNVLLLSAEDGWPVDETKRQRMVEIMNSSKSPQQQKMVVKMLPGSHHFHADPRTAPRVADEVIHFLHNILPDEGNVDNVGSS